MPRCRVLRALKMNRVLYPQGAVLDVPDAIFASLPEGTVTGTTDPISVVEAPTFEEFIAKGGAPDDYPPAGQTARDTAGWVEYRDSKKTESVQAAQERVSGTSERTKKTK